MRSLFFILFNCFSIFIFGQKDDLYLWNKYETYKSFDTIDVYSKRYPTKLIEGSGYIKNKRKKNIGSIGFETEITKSGEQKLLRIYDSQTYFYKKNGKIPAKTVNYKTYIYFDNFAKPDFSKVIQEEIITEKIISSETKFYDLQIIDFDNDNLDKNEKRIRDLLYESKK